MDAIVRARMDEYVKFASSDGLPTLGIVALILGLGKGGVPGLATVATGGCLLGLLLVRVSHYLSGASGDTDAP